MAFQIDPATGQMVWASDPSMTPPSYTPGSSTGNTGVTGGMPPGALPGAAAPAGAAPAGGKGDPEAFRAAWFASGGKTVDDLKAFVAAHPEFGATITGSKGSKVIFPGGQAYQAVRSAGLGGGIGPAWDDLSQAGGGTMAGLGGGIPSSGMVPNTLIDAYNEPFKLPTAEEFYKLPGIQASLDYIQKRGERSAAARGTLLTPGTQMGIDRAATDYIGNQYSTLASLGLAAQRGNFDIGMYNRDSPYSKLYNLSALGKPSA